MKTYSGGPAISIASLPYMPPCTQKKPTTTIPSTPIFLSPLPHRVITIGNGQCIRKMSENKVRAPTSIACQQGDGQDELTSRIWNQGNAGSIGTHPVGGAPVIVEQRRHLPREREISSLARSTRSQYHSKHRSNPHSTAPQVTIHVQYSTVQYSTVVIGRGPLLLHVVETRTTQKATRKG